MKWKTLFIASFYFQITFCHAQDSLFIDTRDGETYPMIEIGDLVWMGENLRFRTETSYCKANKKTKKKCEDGNYYALKEREKVCPEGWRTASLQDWEAYFFALTDTIDGVSIHVDSLSGGEDDYYIQVIDSTGLLNMFEVHNPLGLKPTGWIQGEKWWDMGTITLWVTVPDNDPKYHVHIGKKSYIKHSHKHNILDKKEKRRRRFSVRCVCDIERD